MLLQQDDPTVPPAEAARAARSDVRTRQLLRAAAHLMARNGAHDVSMKAIADEAGVSVGLIYRYFGNKQDLVQAVIVGVLDDMARLISAAIDPEGDPVRRVAAAFAAYCTVVRDNREAVVLTYRESHTLDENGRQLIKDREVQTAEPFRAAVQAAQDDGLLREIDVDLFAFDMLIIAHSWALKHWHFAQRMDFESFVRKQTGLLLSGALRPECRDEYADLLAPAS